MKQWILRIAVATMMSCVISFAKDVDQARDTQESEPQIAGEFFGVPVSLGNYYSAKNAVLRFAAEWRGTPKNEEELEDMVWQELLFSFEAFRRGIESSDEEIDKGTVTLRDMVDGQQETIDIQMIGSNLEDKLRNPSQSARRRRNS